jgi:thymidylate synthase ThyX
MGYSTKIIADSISPAGHHLTTFEVCFPRIVLAEFNTHRRFSRNSASSRAIPVKKMLERVQADPFVPAAFPKNQKGMQASEVLTPEGDAEASFTWRELRNHAMNAAHHLAFPPEDGGLDVHKQIANRLLEPWLWHTVIVTATDWDNFFHLRANPMAQPEIQEAARAMLELYQHSKPTLLKEGQWHLPYIDQEEIDVWAQRAQLEGVPEEEFKEVLVKISCARCARVSYLTHDGKRDPQEDLRLYGDLLKPGHMSPFEHAARPMTELELKLFQQEECYWDAKVKKWCFTGKINHYLGNVNGWVQHRKMIPGEEDILGYREAT